MIRKKCEAVFDRITRKNSSHRPNFFRSGPAVLEAVDVMLGVGYRGVRIAPGEADFKRGEGVAADHERPVVGAADAGVPQIPSGFEWLDPVTLVKTIHGAVPPCGWAEQTMNSKGNM